MESLRSGMKVFNLFLSKLLLEYVILVHIYRVQWMNYDDKVMNYVHNTDQRDEDNNYIDDIYHDDSDVSDFDEEEYDSDVQ